MRSSEKDNGTLHAEPLFKAAMILKYATAPLCHSLMPPMLPWQQIGLGIQAFIPLDTGELGALEDEAGHKKGKKQKAAREAAAHDPPAEDQVRACTPATLPARSAMPFAEGSFLKRPGCCFLKAKLQLSCAPKK